MVESSGLKYRDDDTDAAWLAELLRLGLLPRRYPPRGRACGTRSAATIRSAAMESTFGQPPGGAEPVLAQPRTLAQRQRGPAVDTGVGCRAGHRPESGAGDRGAGLAMRAQQAAIDLLEREPWRQTKATQVWQPLLTVAASGASSG